MSVQLYWSNNKENCLTAKYIDEFHWYLIVEKDIVVFNESFKDQLGKDFIITVIIIIILLMLSPYIVYRYNKIMTKLVTTDELTGLQNRRAFNNYLEKAIYDYKQDKKNFTVFVFDIDRFKSINDVYGHLVGDNVIKIAGQIAKDVLWDSGFIARWGGDEFFGVVYGDNAEVESILLNILNRIYLNDELKKYNASVSIGATCINESDNTDSVLLRADKRLYQSKTNGRNCVTFL